MKIFLTIISLYLLFYSAYWLLLTIFGVSRDKSNQNVLNLDNPELLIILPAYKPGKIFEKVLDAVEKAIIGRNIKVFVLVQEPGAYNPEAYALSKGFFVKNKSFSRLPGNSYQHALQYVTHVVYDRRLEGFWNPEFIMILDKDNIIAADFFAKIPARLYDQFDVIQGQRQPIAVASAVAFFDAISESLNNTMFRSAKNRLGGMVEISGSAALIETDIFVNVVQNLDPDAPGFDKNFMVQLLTGKRNIRSIYWPQSKVMEEKTAAIEAHNPQRVRWFGEQYYNALFSGKELLEAAFQFRRLAALDYLVTLWRPPRSIQLFITPLLSLLEIGWFAYSHRWYFSFPLLTVATILIALAVIIFLIGQRQMGAAFRFAYRLPLIAANNFFNAMKSIKKENQGKFIHTSHEL